MVHFPNFLGKKMFFQEKKKKLAKLQRAVQHHAKIQRNLKNQFHENKQTGGRTEGWRDPIS